LFKSKIGLTKKLLSVETDTVFLVYTIGKVGSRTVAKSLRKLYGNNDSVEVLHLQDIGGAYREKYNSNYFFYANNIIDKTRFFISRKIREKYGNKLLETIKSKKNIYIITLVREPISRAISANFQALESLGRLSNLLKNSRYITYDKMKEFFYRNLDHNSIDMWFDYELYNNFGINIFDYPFDFKNKCIQIKKNNINFLLIRLEDMLENEIVIRNFIGNDSYKTINDNIGKEKWYSDLYSEFKHKFIPSRELTKKYLSSKYTRHFYSSDEINRMKKKYHCDK
jgi:hypothetical protein